MVYNQTIYIIILLSYFVDQIEHPEVLVKEHKGTTLSDKNILTIIHELTKKCNWTLAVIL
jgi:hypothetical protein